MRVEKGSFAPFEMRGKVSYDKLEMERLMIEKRTIREKEEEGKEEGRKDLFLENSKEEVKVDR